MEQINKFDFGVAIQRLRQGKKVARKGWNGKGMFIFLQEKNLQQRITPVYNEGARMECITYQMNEHFVIKNVDNSCSTWVPSINDCLAYDWVEVKEAVVK